MPKLFKRNKSTSPGPSSPRASSPASPPSASTSQDESAHINDEEKEIFWPRDFLIEDFPTARIMTFGYNSRVTQGFEAANQAKIFSHAKNLLYDLEDRRKAAPDRDLLFIAHSLGGILVKEALRRSTADSNGKILAATKGVFFFGTPHAGSRD